jgi:DNA-binding transcriptional MerR regulator
MPKRAVAKPNKKQNAEPSKKQNAEPNMRTKKTKPVKELADQPSPELDFDSAGSDAPRDPISDYEALLALQASDKLYYRIGEVSKLTGVKAHVLRYWETEFRWMTPPKSRSKQRLYRSRDIEFVWLLKRLLWDERYTIAGARQRIQELGVDRALALLQQKPGAQDRGAASAMSGEAASSLAPADWSSFRAALDGMQSELLSVQGVLRETA